MSANSEIFNGGAKDESSEYFNNLINKIKNADDNEDSLSINTEQILDKLIPKYANMPNNNSDMIGGGDFITGKRMLKMEVVTDESFSGGSDYSASEYDEDSDNENYGSKKKGKVGKTFRKYARELGRLIDDQKQQVFERVVNKIMEIIGCDNETARFYKTTLIRMAKKKNEKLTGLDLANEVDKLATSDVLKKIDINKEKEEIMKWRSKHPRQDTTSSTKSNSSDSPTKTKKPAKLTSSDSLTKTKKVTKKVKQGESSYSSSSSDVSGLSEISLNDFSVTSR
jgi:hypothetical protein